MVTTVWVCLHTLCPQWTQCGASALLFHTQTHRGSTPANEAKCPLHDRLHAITLMFGWRCMSVRLLYSLLIPKASSTSLYSITKIRTPCCCQKETHRNFSEYLPEVCLWLAARAGQQQCLHTDISPKADAPE